MPLKPKPSKRADQLDLFDYVPKHDPHAVRTDGPLPQTGRYAMATPPLARRLHFQSHQPSQTLYLFFAHRPSTPAATAPDAAIAVPRVLPAFRTS
jgi:hypothetical protein